MGFSYTIVADICEGVGDCIPVCPVECIHWAIDQTNAKGTAFVYIDGGECINCHACLAVCPVEGAILDEWEPTLQSINNFDRVYAKFQARWRTPKVLTAARQLRQDRSRDAAVVLADALRSAGCKDLRLTHHLRSDPPAEVVWVATFLLKPTDG